MRAPLRITKHGAIINTPLTEMERLCQMFEEMEEIRNKNHQTYINLPSLMTTFPIEQYYATQNKP